MKAFGFSREEALHGVSYANIVLFSATLPSYEAPRGEGGEEVIDAGDPRNAEAVARAFSE